MTVLALLFLALPAPRASADAGQQAAHAAQAVGVAASAEATASVPTSTPAPQAVDDAGRTLSLAQPARRIVTLAPNLTEFVYDLGAGDRIVATVHSSDHPEAARALPRVGDHQRIDLERVVQLKPDLVLAWLHGNPAREWEPLVRLGIPVFLLEPRRLDDLPGTWRRLGALLGQPALAEQRVQAFEARRATLAAAQEGQAQLTVFYQVWREPLMTLNDQHMVTDVIRLCGGRNVFGALAPLVPRVGVEDVLKAAPEVILTAGPDVGDDEQAPHWWPARDHAELRNWQRHEQLPAVRDGHLYAVAGDLLTRQGPRILEGAQAACEALAHARQGRPRER